MAEPQSVDARGTAADVMLRQLMEHLVRKGMLSRGEQRELFVRGIAELMPQKSTVSMARGIDYLEKLKAEVAAN